MAKAIDCIGPLGFKMRESAARIVEQAMRSQPSDVRNLYKSKIVAADGKEITVDGYVRQEIIPDQLEFNEVKDAKGVSVEHSDTAVITADNVDRDREVVIASGLDFSTFTRNPVVPFVHDYTKIGVGISPWVAKAKIGKANGWRAKTVYSPRPPSLPSDAEWFPDTAWWLGKTGHLRGRSIGFIPMVVRQVTSNDIAGRPDWEKALRIIESAMVIEYSVCLLPCQPDSLTDEIPAAKSAGVIIGKSSLERFGIILTDPSPSTKDVSADTGTGDGFAIAPEPKPSPSKRMPKRSNIVAVLPDHVHAAVKSIAGSIDKSHLMDAQPDDHHPHVKSVDTSDPQEVQNCVKGYGACHATVGKMCSVHVADGKKSLPEIDGAAEGPHDQVHLMLHSYDMKGLHKTLAVLPHNEKGGADYQPTIHLANVKAGHGETVCKDMGGDSSEMMNSMSASPLHGLSMRLNGLSMKTPDDEEHDISLTGEKSFKTALEFVFGKSGAPVACPQCGKTEGVEKLPDDDASDKDYDCSICSLDFDDGDKPGVSVKPEKTVNAACLEKAIADAAAGKTTGVDWIAPTGEARRKEFCLIEDKTVAEDSPARFKYPIFAADGTLNRQAVAMVKRRGANIPALVTAADSIAKAIQDKTEADAKTASAMTDAQLSEAVKKTIESQYESLVARAMEKTETLIRAATGKV